MRNWRLLSLVLVALLAAVVWRALPTPTAHAQGMKLPPGVSLTTKKYDTMGMPGVKTLTWNRLEMKPGAKFLSPDADMGPKTWDFCLESAGTMTVTANGKTRNIPPGTWYTVPQNTKLSLFNNGRTTVVDIFWEFETQ